MKTARFLIAALATASAAVAAPPPASLVPRDATAVGSFRFDRWKETSIRQDILGEADKLTLQGDAARFLQEAGLDPSRDVDAVTFWVSGAGTDSHPVAVFEGRFQPARLAVATTARGAVAMTQAPYTYYRLPHPDSGQPTAVAFVDATTAVAGSEAGVVDALKAMQKAFLTGPSPAIRAGMARLDPSAAAWVVIDGAKLRSTAGPHDHSEGGPTGQLTHAFQSVSTLVFQASAEKDTVAVKATGLATDAQTRKDLEDLVRGVLAGWRMSVDEKNPELVSALRKFTVASDGDGVTVSGKLPLSAFPKSCH